MESMWCHCQLLSISSMREVFLRSSASSGRSMHYYFSSPALSRVNSHPQPYFMPHAPEVVWLSSLMRTETALLKAWDTCGVLKHSFLEQNDWPLLFSRVLVLCQNLRLYPENSIRTHLGKIFIPRSLYGFILGYQFFTIQYIKPCRQKERMCSIRPVE